MCSGGKAEPGRVREKVVCQSPSNEMDLDAGHVAGGWTAWYGLAGEAAEGPHLTLGEISHALLAGKELPSCLGVGEPLRAVGARVLGSGIHTLNKAWRPHSGVPQLEALKFSE